jgi:NADPH:quinone reductase-like Zn-dependent oxidoreductase
MGVIPIDYRAEDVVRRVHELAPGGVAGVVDHVGGPGIVDSWRMLARGGHLIGLSDMTIIDAAHPMIPFLRLYLRLQLWNLLPNGRGAAFFDIWAGHRRRPDHFRQELRADLEHLFALLAEGSLDAPIDSTFPLHEAAAALRHAERGGLAGKVVLVPQPR